MDARPSASTFRTTSWTLVLRPTSTPSDLGQLLGIYWNPVYAFLRRKGFNRDDAADQVQAFFGHVIKKDLVKRADPERGRFRSYLCKCLMNYVRDHPAVPGGPPRIGPIVDVPDDLAAIDALLPQDTDPRAAFDREWMRKVLTLVRQRLEEECLAQGLAQHWDAYEARVLQPVLLGGDKVTIASLAQSMNLPPDQVSHMIETVRRKSARLLREVVADTIDDPADLEDEIDTLCRYVSS